MHIPICTNISGQVWRVLGLLFIDGMGMERLVCRIVLSDLLWLWRVVRMAGRWISLLFNFLGAIHLALSDFAD